jgi:creatinine amidohydrolase
MRWTATWALLAGVAVSATALPGQAPRAAPPAVRSVYIEDLTWPEVRDAIRQGRTTALIYTGSTEQNGPHMVIGKHTFIAHYVAGQIAERLGDALVYPTLPFAPTGSIEAKTGHMAFPGSVSLTGSTYEAVVREIARSAIGAGFREVYVMGDHGGGQAELRHAAATVQAAVRAAGIRVRYVPDIYFKAAEQVGAYLTAHGITVGKHAGTGDTSELMALDSTREWIRWDRLAASDSTQWARTGVDGDPTKATPEMGRIFLEQKIADGVAQIRALRRGKL